MGFFHLASADEIVTKEAVIAVNDVVVPDAVQKDTDAKVVLIGMFPSSCYRWARAEVSSPDDFTHHIKAISNVTLNTMCLMVLVPFHQEVNLGQLAPGAHVLRIVSGDGTYFERKLVVQ